MEERTGTIKSYIEAPRWAAFPEFLRNRCFVLGLDLELDIDKGWIRETVRFKIEGKESVLRQFIRELDASMKDYNEI